MPPKPKTKTRAKAKAKETLMSPGVAIRDNRFIPDKHDDKPSNDDDETTGRQTQYEVKVKFTPVKVTRRTTKQTLARFVVPVDDMDALVGEMNRMSMGKTDGDDDETLKSNSDSTDSTKPVKSDEDFLGLYTTSLQSKKDGSVVAVRRSKRLHS